MKRILGAFLLLFPVLVFAVNSLDTAASNVNAIVAFIYRIVDVILYLGAAIMGISGLLKYRLHRQNPQQVPLSTPVTELGIAAVLVLLGVLAQLSISHKTVENPGMPRASISTQQPTYVAPRPAPTPTPNTPRQGPPPSQYPY